MGARRLVAQFRGGEYFFFTKNVGPYFDSKNGSAYAVFHKKRSK